MSRTVSGILALATISAIMAAAAISRAAYEFSQPLPPQAYEGAAVNLGAGVFFALFTIGYLAAAVILSIDATKGGE